MGKMKRSIPKGVLCGFIVALMMFMLYSSIFLFPVLSVFFGQFNMFFLLIVIIVVLLLNDNIMAFIISLVFFALTLSITGAALFYTGITESLYVLKFNEPLNVGHRDAEYVDIIYAIYIALGVFGAFIGTISNVIEKRNLTKKTMNATQNESKY